MRRFSGKHFEIQHVVEKIQTKRLHFWWGGEKNNVEFVDNQTRMGYNVDELGERYEDIAGRIA